MIFNYRNFLKEEFFNHFVKINDEGLVLKTSSSTSFKDEDGGIITYELTEVKDDLVNLVYKNTLRFYEISNKNEKLNTNINLEQNWNFIQSSCGYDKNRIAKMEGESIGDDLSGVIYITDKGNPQLLVNKNAYDQNLPEDIVRIDLVPSYKFIGNKKEIKIERNILKVVIKSDIIEFYLDEFINIDYNENGQFYLFSQFLETNSNQEYKNIYVNIVGAQELWLNGEYKINSLINIEYDYNSFGEPNKPIYFKGVSVDKKYFKIPSNFQTTELNYSLTDNVKLNYFYYATPIKRAIDTNIYSLLGLWGKPTFKFKPNYEYSEQKAFLSKKSFYKKIKNLSKILNESGIDVVVIPYMENLIEVSREYVLQNPAPYYKHIYTINEDGSVSDNYYIDTNYSFLKRKYKKNEGFKVDNINPFTPIKYALSDLFDDDYVSPTFEDSIKAGNLFLNFKKNPPLNLEPSLLDIKLDDVSPFDSSVRDVISALYGPKKELLDRLNEIYNESIDKLKDDKYLMLSDFSVNTFKKYFNLIFCNRSGDSIAKISDYILKLQAVGVGAGTIFGGGAGAIVGYLLGKELDTILTEIKKWEEDAKNYEYFTGESILGNGLSIGELNEYVDKTEKLKNKKLHNLLARVLIPVDMGYEKSRKRGKKNGKIVWKKYKKDLGVRWVEVYFINSFVHKLNRISEKISGEEIKNLNLEIDTIIPGDIKKEYIEGNVGENSYDVVEKKLRLKYAQNIVNFGQDIYFEIKKPIDSLIKNKYEGVWYGVVLNEYEILFKTPLSVDDNVSDVIISRIIKPYSKSKQSSEPISCQVVYKIPDLPPDNIIRDIAFNKYGPFDQSEFSINWNDFKTLKEFGITHESRNISIDELMNALSNVNKFSPKIAGFEIFKKTSRSILDLRKDIDIINKVSFLLTILKDAFGESRVDLIETTRSHEDQEVLQLGGPSSNFLSWHNYGLAVKINIKSSDGVSLIKEGSEDFYTLLSIAEGFTEAAYKGMLGKPCNVVWCGRLKTGPNIFVWEFLPIGINHKDSVKFRDAFYNQMDAIEVLTPVNVDKLGIVKDFITNDEINVPDTEEELNNDLYIYYEKLISNNIDDIKILEKIDELEYILNNPNNISSQQRIYEKKRLYKYFSKYFLNRNPYILKSSNAYKNAIIINGDHYVYPKDINNYPIHKNLILKDIQEFLFLIKNKFLANGTTLMDGQRVIDWKNMNPISFEQLILFNALLGNISIVKKLISIDYVSFFDNLIPFANSDPVKFVKSFIGLKEYLNIKIYIDGLDRESCYISLHDGKLTISIFQIRSSHPEGFSNIFGEKFSDISTIEFGQLRNGIFYPEKIKDPDTGEIIKNKMEMIRSKNPVISGYDPNGNIIYPNGYKQNDGTIIPCGDAYFIHVIIKDKILEYLKKIKESFENLKINFLHDYFYNSPNKNKLIENEFGVIASQDLIDFDELKNIYNKININKVGNDSLGNSRGISEDSGVYEKLISNTQFTGIQFSRNIREKPKIEQIKTESMEKLLNKFIGKTSPDVNDIL